MRLQTRSSEFWNSEDVKKGKPMSAHSLRTKDWVCKEADQLTVPPPPHA